jgi:hypothetical protein
MSNGYVSDGFKFHLRKQPCQILPKIAALKTSEFEVVIKQGGKIEILTASEFLVV